MRGRDGSPPTAVGGVGLLPPLHRQCVLVSWPSVEVIGDGRLRNKQLLPCVKEVGSRGGTTRDAIP